jgi:hypothetical protein
MIRGGEVGGADCEAMALLIGSDGLRLSCVAANPIFRQGPVSAISFDDMPRVD